MPVSVSDVFRLLGDETRLRSLLLLAAEGELCVCELTWTLDVVQPKISRHLAQLRAGGLVRDRRDGQWVHYRLAPELPDWAHAVIRAAEQGAAGCLADDRRRLRAMPDRPAMRCAG